MKQLSDWPQPISNSGIGLHYNTKPNPPLPNQETLETWRRMGVMWVKLLTNGLDTLPHADLLAKASFMVVVRFYAERPHPDYVPAVDLMKRFADVGVRYAEGGNEADHREEQSMPLTIADLARQYLRFADASAHAGIIPCFYAFEGDRLHKWVLPTMRYIIEREGRRDALEGSAVAGHWRPGNYWRKQPDGSQKEYPPDYPPLEPNGEPGFVFGSYKAWDDEIVKLLGGSLPFIGTEAGYEPSDVRGDLQLHASLNAQIATMEWRPALFCQTFWTWLPDWGGSGAESSGWLGKPVVEAFKRMEKRIRNGLPPVPPSDASLDAAARDVGLKLWERYPWVQKEAVRRGVIQGIAGQEFSFSHGGRSYLAQLFVTKAGAVVIYCEEGHYTPEETQVVEI